jgi:hypothetical protein
MTEPTQVPQFSDPQELASWIWFNLVPSHGQSKTVQGELLRCVERLRWEAQNNGNMNWDFGYADLIEYLERTLCSDAGLSEERQRAIREDLALLRDHGDAYMEDDLYERLTGHVAAYCRMHPQLIFRQIDPNRRI